MDSTMMDGIRGTQGMMVQARGKSSEERIDAGIANIENFSNVKRLFTPEEREAIDRAMKDQIKWLWRVREDPDMEEWLKNTHSALRKLRRLSKGY